MRKTYDKHYTAQIACDFEVALGHLLTEGYHNCASLAGFTDVRLRFAN